MARDDPTFTDSDLLRFYCRNLDPAEKYRVFHAFSEYILRGVAICPDDPEEPTHACAWVDHLAEIMTRFEDLAITLPKIVGGLVALEVLLAGLSWAGPLARILHIFRLLVAYLIVFLTYVAALAILVSQLAPFVHYLQRLLCSGEKPLPLEAPPGVDDLPAPPTNPLDDFIHKLEDFWDWLSANPDEWEDGQPV